MEKPDNKNKKYHFENGGFNRSLWEVDHLLYIQALEARLSKAKAKLEVEVEKAEEVKKAVLKALEDVGMSDYVWDELDRILKWN